MVGSDSHQVRTWTGLIFVIAGLLMIILWVIFTTVHGPTSFDRKGEMLGRSTFFWGSMLSGVPNLLLVLGLFGARGYLGATANRLSKAGFIVTIFGLFVPAAADLAAGSMGPPLLVPLVGLGLFLLAVANRNISERGIPTMNILAALGSLQLIASGWGFLPRALSNQIFGYRVYGVLAYLLFGAGWMLLGDRIIRTQKLHPGVDLQR